MSEEVNDLYNIRPARADDVNFILATWLRGAYYGDSWFSLVPKDIFMQQFKRIISSLLINPNVKTSVACLKEDPAVILGYSVVSKNDETVIWVFVKKAWREQGIGRSLLPPAPRYVMLLTEMGKMLLSKLPGAQFNPFYDGNSTT